MSVFNETPEEFYDLNGLFPVLNSAVGLTYVQFQKLVENTIWLKNREDKIGVVYSYVAGGSPSQFGQYWLSATDSGIALTPDTNFIYIMLSSGNFQKWLFRWNGTTYEPLNKDFESYASATNFPITGISNIFYLALDTSVIYYWNGTAYVEASGTDLTNYYTKTETNDLLDEKADKNRIENSDNTSYFEAGGNVYNSIGDAEQSSLFAQENMTIYNNVEDNYQESKLNVGNSLIIMEHRSKTSYKTTRLSVANGILMQFYDAGNHLVGAYVMSENRTNPDEVAKISDIKGKSVANYEIETTDWVADSTYSDLDFNYKATITISGVLSTEKPEVAYSPADSVSGNFSNFPNSVVDGIEIWCKETPTSTIIIPLARTVIV